MKKNNNKGFTLAELLIVVAIIAVLTAIAIPVFTTQLEKSRESTDLANIRSAYAEVMTNILTWDGSGEIPSVTVNAQQTQSNWQNANNSANTTIAGGISGDEVTVAAKVKPDNWVIGASSDANGSIGISFN